MVVARVSVDEFNVNPQFGRLITWQDIQVLFVVYAVEKA